MVDRWYAATPSDFAMALGAKAFIVDEAGDPTADKGWALLIPDQAGGAITLNVYDAFEGTQITTLKDRDGNPITALTPQSSFDHAGEIFLFQVLDAPEGDVWISQGGVDDSWFRLSPMSDELFARIAAVETGLDALVTTDLENWSTDDPDDGDVPVWSESLGEWVPSASGTGTVQTVNGVSPTAGDVELEPTDLGAAAQANTPAYAWKDMLGVGTGIPNRTSVPGSATAPFVIWVLVVADGDPPTAGSGVGGPDQIVYTDLLP